MLCVKGYHFTRREAIPIGDKLVELANLLDFYGELLTEKQRDYLEMYSQNDLSLAEIAANEGITRQGVRDIVSRAENVLREYDRKLGVIERFGNIRGTGERVAALSEAILTVNMRKYTDNEIREAAQELREIAAMLTGE